MTMKKTVRITGEILDERADYTLRQVCEVCGVRAEIIWDMVSEGIAEPSGESAVDWHFSGVDIVRIRTAVRLQRDLQVNLPGAAMVLDLLEELRELREKVRAGPLDSF